MGAQLAERDERFQAMTPSWESEFHFYWVAGRHFLSGGNPYDFQSLKLFAQQLGDTSVGPVYFPPWTFILILPLLFFDFATAAWILYVVNLVMVALFIWLGMRIAKPANGAWSQALCGALFLPLYLPLLFGQVSLIFTAALYGALVLIRTGFPLIAGTSLGIACMKPHLWYLLPFWLVLTLPIRTILKLGIGAALSIGSMLFACLYLNPSILENYFRSESNPLSWLGASGVTFLRLWFSSPTDPFPIWPVWCAFALGLMGVAWLRTKGTQEKLDARKISLLLTLSTMTTPYIWMFDFAILTLPILWISQFSRQSLLVFLTLVGISFCAGYIDHHSAWIPIAIFAFLVAPAMHSPRPTHMENEL